jgi:hypothetical protein
VARPVRRDLPVKPWEIALADETGDRATKAPQLRALDVRADHRVLAGLPDRDLAAVALVPEGTPLWRYRLYLDLHDPGRAEFAAEGTEVVKPGQRLVARDGTDPEVWSALRRACGHVTGRQRAG